MSDAFLNTVSKLQKNRLSALSTTRSIFIRKAKVFALVLLCTGLTGQSVVLADEVDEEETVFTLDTMVVTAAGHEQEIRDAPASISVVTREELEKGSYNDLWDALRNLPGVNFSAADSDNANSADVSMRGMGAAYTVFLIDGRRTSTRETQTNGSAGTNQNWTPPLEAIERIEVVRGPMSSLYGSDAMGGVINIITRKVSEEWRGSVRNEVTMQERSKSGNIYQSNFHMSGPIKTDVLGLTLFGTLYKREEDDILNGFMDYANTAINARLALTPNSNHDIIAEAGTGRQHYTGNAGKTLAPDASSIVSNRNHTRSNYALQHTGRLSWATADTHVQYEKAHNRERDQLIKNTNIRSNWAIPLGVSHMVNVGANYNRQDLKDTTTNALSDRSTADRDAFGVFGEDEWRLHRAFAMTGGLRYDHDSHSGGNVSPRLYGVWRLSSQWTVKGGIATGFRAPGLREVLDDWGNVSRGGNRIGNPDLKPEKTFTKEAGILYGNDNGEGFSMGLTLFHNSFTDKFLRVRCSPETDPDRPECSVPNSSGNYPTTFINIDEAITYGVEASVGIRLTEGLRLGSGYTYTDSEQKTGNTAGLPLTNTPKHLFNISLDWDPTERVNGWVKVSYRGKESDTTGAISQGNFIQASYTIADIGASYRLSRGLALRVGVSNLLDKEVLPDGINYNRVLDGRRYWLATNFNF